MNFEYSSRISGMKASIIRELLKQMNNPELISFAGGSPAEQAFPIEEISKISAKLLEQSPIDVLQYSVTDGVPQLKVAAKNMMNAGFDTVKEDDDIIVTTGSQQVMDFVTKLLCNEGDTIVCENPAFLGALNVFKSYAVKLRGVELEDDGVNLCQLEAAFAQTPKPKFYYTIPNFQNPTGITTSLEKRRAVYELAVKYNVPVLEDNPYGALRFTGKELPPIKSFDESGTVIYAASMSKILAPGMRIAFCVAQKDFITKMGIVKQGSDVHTCTWSQYVCQRFLDECDMNAHLAKIKSIYAKSAQLMMSCINKTMGDNVKYVAPEGGMFIWLTLPAEISVPEYVSACLKNKVAIVPGAAFYAEDDAKCQAVRLNFSKETPERIEQGISIMAEILNKML